MVGLDNPVILAILAIGVLAAFISWIAVTCSSLTFHLQPFSLPAPGLALSPGNLLTGVNTLSPDLGLILGDGRQNSGMKPPGW